LRGTHDNAAHRPSHVRLLGTTHVDASLGRVVVRKPEARELDMPKASKFRATESRTEDAAVHVYLASKANVNVPGKV